MTAEPAPLVVILGPTAVGKSRLALALAERLGGEIISADSRQVYRYLDIGTAKPSAEERARVPHHLIDVVDPDQTFTVAHYRELALQAIADIQQRGKRALLVGGSALYLRTITHGISVPAVPPDHEFRRQMEATAQEHGADEVRRRLAAVDPEAAQRIDPHNVRRLIRALEVWRATGVAFSSLQHREPAAFPLIQLGLTAPRATLYEWADARVETMMRAGLLEEVRGLAARGYGWDLPAMSGIGYRQLGEHLRGELTLEAAVAKIKTETHRFIRRQYTWFRLDDPDTRWFTVDNNHEQIATSLAAELIERPAPA